MASLTGVNITDGFLDPDLIIQMYRNFPFIGYRWGVDSVWKFDKIADRQNQPLGSVVERK
jgi:hypothetical protein